MKRLGWIVLGRTGRVWVPLRDTAARTRTAALAKWRQPFGEEYAWRAWEKLYRAGRVKAVRTYFTEPEPGGRR